MLTGNSICFIKKMTKSYLATFILITIVNITCSYAQPSSSLVQQKSPVIGAYYFEGWAGSTLYFPNSKEPWVQNAPTHLSKRLVEEFPQRQPVWGWRDDSPAIMERQISLAADNGLSFFAFDWYRRGKFSVKESSKIIDDPLNSGLKLFLTAPNNTKLKFCLLVANHGEMEIKNIEQWKQVVDIWLPYLKHPQYLRVDGKPLLIILVPSSNHKEGLALLQKEAVKAGLPGVAVAAVGGGSPDIGYSYKTHYNILPKNRFNPEAHSYADMIAAGRSAWSGSTKQPYIPVVTSGWDKRPWEGPTGLNQPVGTYYPDRSPQQFKQFLNYAIHWMNDNPHQTTSERIILVWRRRLHRSNAWRPRRGVSESNSFDC